MTSAGDISGPIGLRQHHTFLKNILLGSWRHYLKFRKSSVGTATPRRGPPTKGGECRSGTPFC